MCDEEKEEEKEEDRLGGGRKKQSWARGETEKVKNCERKEACGGGSVGELSETTEKPQSTKLALSPKHPPSLLPPPPSPGAK